MWKASFIPISGLNLDKIRNYFGMSFISVWLQKVADRIEKCPCAYCTFVAYILLRISWHLKKNTTFAVRQTKHCVSIIGWPPYLAVLCFSFRRGCGLLLWMDAFLFHLYDYASSCRVGDVLFSTQWHHGWHWSLLTIFLSLYGNLGSVVYCGKSDKSCQLAFFRIREGGHKRA